MVTGLNNNSAQRFQLNAGIFLKNFDYSSAENAEDLLTLIAAAADDSDYALGATTGGGSFQCTPTIRQIEADGMRAPVVGSTVNDGWVIKLTGTMKEITDGNLKDALISADVTTDGDVKTITVRDVIEDTDYIDNLCWIGDRNDGAFVLIEIENALNLTGANFTFTDKGEGSLPFEFQAHKKTVTGSTNAPCKVLIISEETVSE